MDKWALEQLLCSGISRFLRSSNWFSVGNDGYACFAVTVAVPTVALGHAPSAVNDVYVKGPGNNEGIDTEYIQYDSILIQVMTTTV